MRVPNERHIDFLLGKLSARFARQVARPTLAFRRFGFCLQNPKALCKALFDLPQSVTIGHAIGLTNN
jgi:hypothetical protein